MGTYTDEELMGLVQGQDISAFEELFRRYEQRVFAFFWRLSANRQEAEDGTQETFLRLWKTRVRYEPVGRFSTYLFQIAKNHFLHERQKRHRRGNSQQPPANRLPARFEAFADPWGDLCLQNGPFMLESLLKVTICVTWSR